MKKKCHVSIYQALEFSSGIQKILCSKYQALVISSGIQKKSSTPLDVCNGGPVGK